MLRTASLAFLLLPACAYQQAMHRGEAALAAADYDAARRAYGFAYDAKSSPAALDGMRRAQAEAVARQLDGAEAAVAAGRHVEADRMLREVELLVPDDERLAKVRASARAKMMEALATRVDDEEGDIREAYELVTLARRLYPDAAEPEYALATLRSRAVDEARAQADAHEYAAARETVGLIAEMEPWQEALTSELDHEFASAWADEVLAPARAARRNQPGLAAILYARAYEIAERPEDLEAARALYEQAGSRGPVAVYVNNGPTGQATALKKSAMAALEETPGTTAGRSNRWDLLAKIYASDPTCRETKTSEQQVKEYVSGQREVPNPEYESVKAELDAATAAVEEAAATAEALLPRESEAAAEVTRLDLDLKARQRELEDVSSVLEQTRVQQTRWTADVAAVQAEIDGLAADATAARADAEERLKMTQGYAKEWSEKLERDVENEASAKQKVEAAKTALAEAQAEAQKLTAERQEAETARSAARQQLATVQARLTPLPTTVMEDVPDVLKYDDVTWTNTCTSRVTVYLGTGWTPKPESPQKFEVVRTTSDLAHVGHEKAGITEDPKAYPVEKDALIAEVEADSQRQVDQLLVGLVDQYFAMTLEAAFDTMDADEATNVLTGIYAGAPARMDSATRDRYAALLAETYGLESLETLAPEPPPPPAQATSTDAEPEAAPDPEPEAAQDPEPEAAEAPAAEGAETPAPKASDQAAQPAGQPWGSLDAG